MRRNLFAFGELAAPVVAVAACWVLVFQLNGWLFSSLEQSRWVHWVFLPAAVRVLAVLLFSKRGAVGLILGAAVTLDAQNLTLPAAIALPVTSGLAPWIAVHAWRRLFRIRDDLFGLNPVHIIVLSLACAVANALLLNGCLLLSGQSAGGFLQIMATLIGDAFGTAIILFFLSVTLSSSRSRRAYP